jgi:hypothetical protein
MYCPVCKAEYRPGFTRCNDCGSDLVDVLPAEKLPSDVALAWRGSDPVSFSAALAALRNAGIPTYTISDHDQLAWGLAIPRPRYSLLVSSENLEKALQSVSGIDERPPLAFGRTPDWALEEDKARDSSNAQGEQQIPNDVVRDLRPEEATAEVWAGERGGIAQMLEICLRENGISCVMDESGRSTRIRVVPESESRAREIIREVVEGTPPE